ncbi:DNA polymerase III subunit gamma/tau [Candidatus Desantisbacteria bacterium]|nr:DNA polymerase III subunit gamma/tau [Candidatus Desantisbacteria bacterium]
MSYMVIARRWRPNDFDNIVGQKHVSQTLKNAIASGRIAHAYLFSGPRGIGKTSMARVLAKALNCEKGPTETPCQECIPCKEITEGYSLDVIEIDGASNTSVEDVRALRENVKFLPTRGRYKVYIIDEVHMLSKSAFNALLKTLEEPPSHVIFIFATTEPHKIPLTIISRCQRFEFKKISHADIVDTLNKITKAENANIEIEALEIITKNAEGSLRDAETLLEQIMASSGKNVSKQDVIDLLGLYDQEIFSNFVDCIIKNDLSGMLGIIDEIVKYGRDLEQFLKGLIEYCRNLLIILSCSSPEKILEINEYEIVHLKEQAKKITHEDLLTLMHILSTSETQLRHEQVRYQLEFMCLKINIYAKTESLSDLAEKITSLEKKMRNNIPDALNNSNIKNTAIAGDSKISQLNKPLPKENLLQKADIKTENSYVEPLLNKEAAEERNIAEPIKKYIINNQENILEIFKELDTEMKKNKKTILASCITSAKSIELKNLQGLLK